MTATRTKARHTGIDLCVQTGCKSCRWGECVRVEASAVTRQDLHIILTCQHGYRSSLAAATLQQLGLIHATPLTEFTAWAAAGLPVIAPPTADQYAQRRT